MDTADVRLEFPSGKQLEAIIDALSPEISTSLPSRAKVELKRKGTSLILLVEAKDTVALRSALNAVLRLISSIVNVMQILESS